MVLSCIGKMYLFFFFFFFLQYLKAILDSGVFSRDFGTKQESVKLEDAVGKVSVKVFEVSL